MSYMATALNAAVQGQTTGVLCVSEGGSVRRDDPFDEDIEDPSDEPWSVASKRRGAVAGSRPHRLNELLELSDLHCRRPYA